MFGGVDRGGGREGKKSLRKNKIQIDAKVKALQKGHVAGPTGPETTASPPAIRPVEHASLLVDCGLQLLSRQFDRDMLKVLQRATSSGVDALIVYTTDFEKAEALVRLARENAAVVYAMVGIHSDMVKRSSDKLSAQRLEQLREAALRPETVAVMAGLDFSRDIGIRYAQERALQQHVELAVEVGLPLMLYQVSAAEALIEKVREVRAQQTQQEPGTTAPNRAGQRDPTRIAIYNFSGTADELAAFCSLDCYAAVSGRAAAPGDDGQALRTALQGACPLNRLLVCSDSPYSTPQNIDDAYVRDGRNEPSNLPHTVQALASSYGLSEAEMAARLHRNALDFFGIWTELEEQAERVAASQGPDVTAASEPSPSQASNGKAASCVRESGSDCGALEEAEEDREGRRGPARLGLLDPCDSESDADEPEGRGSGANDACGAAASAREAGPAAEVLAGQRPRRQKPQPAGMTVLANKPAARTYLADEDPLGGPPRVTYTCRGCGSTLLTDLHVRPHHWGCSDLGQAEFKRSDRSTAKAKGGHQRGGIGEEQLCSIHFLRASLPWMIHPAGCAESSTEGTASRPALEAQGQEGRIDCPCCASKLGKYSMTGGIACSCGVELPGPAFGVLRARLDIKDSGLDLARAVKASLQLYEAAEQEDEGAARRGGSGDSEDSDQVDKKKKKKKGAKGRSNTGNFSSFRNKTFGMPASKSGKGAKGVAGAAPQGHSEKAEESDGE